jgi:phospholipid/cholesterol/gamma-HCH transport system substrate-binding protein
MQTSVPSFSRILVMVVFALSCFGLLLFLWLSFGGPIPLKPKGYRVQVAFAEATQLGLEADVRVAGVSVGKLRKKELDPRSNRTLADLEIDRKFAPLRTDTKATLRQKSLLGETYVELTPGSSEKTIPEGGRLPDGQVKPTVELDEIFQALDPQTRAAFRNWQQDLGEGITGRGRDFNDALGTLPGFAHDGADILEVLDAQEGAVTRLVKNTGVTFGALTENEQQLSNLITSASRVFDATAAENDSLAEAIRIFPTFLDESKATVERLRTFSTDTRPLIQDLQPVARDLQPTLRDVRALSPDLRRFFRDLDPLIKVSRTGLPAGSEVLRGLKPTLAELTPFLQQINPILQYFEASQFQVTDFLTNGAAALADTEPSPSGGNGHYLRQFGPTGSESLAIHRKRLETNRGNAYPGPLALFGDLEGKGIWPNYDCKPSGGEVAPAEGKPGCRIAGPVQFGDDTQRLQGAFPQVREENYDAGSSR